MKLIIILPTFLLLLATFAQAQTPTRNIRHLTREQYIQQIELCADSAYAEIDMPGFESTYDENTYEWIVGVIDQVVGYYRSTGHR
jgi:hypothetical protein